MLRCDQKRNPSRLAEFEGRLHVGRVEDPFDGYYVSRFAIEEHIELGIDLQKPICETAPAGGTYGSKCDRRVSIAVALDNSVARGLASRVNPKDAHR